MLVTFGNQLLTGKNKITPILTSTTYVSNMFLYATNIVGIKNNINTRHGIRHYAILFLCVLFSLHKVIHFIFKIDQYVRLL